MTTFDYAPAPESRDIARLEPSYGIFVDGEFRDGPGEAVKTINPANEQPLAEVAEAGAADVDDAVGAARAAFDGAGVAMPGRERAKYLFRIARAIQERGRRAGRAGVAGQRQADPGIARRGRPDRGGALLLLRRLGRQAGARRLRAPTRDRSAWPARSSRGTSRC